jgi:hypothetical protein
MFVADETRTCERGSGLGSSGFGPPRRFSAFADGLCFLCMLHFKGIDATLPRIQYKNKATMQQYEYNVVRSAAICSRKGCNDPVSSIRRPHLRNHIRNAQTRARVRAWVWAWASWTEL